jgi:hypothetical protein
MLIVQWELTGDWEVKYTAEYKGTRLTICDAGEEGDLLGYSYLLTIPGTGTFELTRMAASMAEASP